MKTTVFIFTMLFAGISFSKAAQPAVSCTWFADYAMHDYKTGTPVLFHDWNDIKLVYNQKNNSFSAEIELLRNQYVATVVVSSRTNDFTDNFLNIDIFEMKNGKSSFTAKGYRRGHSSENSDLTIYTPEVGYLAAERGQTPDVWLEAGNYPSHDLMGRFTINCKPFEKH